MAATRLKALLHPAFMLRSMPLVVALAISCVVTYEFNAAARQAHVMVEHSMTALAAMDKVPSLLQDAETGQRGFVITEGRRLSDALRQSSWGDRTQLAKP
ncbi:CHASE3 domain-containing protein (plasmid) [Mesorhizobium sp. AR07]|uniref:CHASE3 domain-containing protein n=1 Tax=Mesorhizobium sp. AR07 TaxID=2865838 RepID=UPI00215F4F2A|nr:CHASE3 domain-containing protein [Mesorhizobium sp. AR07]UVK49408.1 CHASE3 domain-containing protein [Mesorhizobium sp. AR07]